MNFESLSKSSGEWLKGCGVESDIVISSRIRLARNLAGFPFPNRASNFQKAEIETLLKDRIQTLEFEQKFEYVSLTTLNTLDRQFLVERQLISRELAANEGPRGVALGNLESLSLMVNEEDHLRLQVMRSGFSLESAWETINKLDDFLEKKVSYAFHEEFGYLTACPTNVGTGMRASVMLHLPALDFTKQIDKVFRALQRINLTHRGLYGEGSRFSGHFFQISNQVTLGKSENAILNEIYSVIPQIIDYERQARVAWKKDNGQILQDRISRAFGTLSSATMMTSDETMELLSYVRLGIHMKMIEDVDINTVNELFIQTQPAHLQKLMGSTLDGEERNTARAKFLRSKLRSSGSNSN